MHTVTLSAYWIDRTEVTNSMYALCVLAGACNSPGRVAVTLRPNYYNDPLYAQYPVVWVNWTDAFAYCQWAGRRLPSEAEWEKAARGPDGWNFPWGNSLKPGYSNTGNFTTGTSHVENFPGDRSIYGVLDMAGNVSEWVQDYYAKNYQDAESVDPTGPQVGIYGRTVRGGSWESQPANVFVFSRSNQPEDYTSERLGFRCAMNPAP